MLIWPLVFAGAIEIATAFSPTDWHAHEMIFGYLAAVIGGFLLTATPNWTGRLPVAGWPLSGLAALWAAGRLTMFFSAYLGRPLSAFVDCAFLVVFAAVMAREILAGKNYRNLKVVTVVALLAVANAAFHWEDAFAGDASYAERAALSLVVMLVLLIGGRVTPSFTNNWLARQSIQSRPAPFSKADGFVIVLTALALIAWTLAPDLRFTGALTLAAGLGNFWRLFRWRGFLARREALVLVLHLGFGLASAGFLFASAHGLLGNAFPNDAAVHAWAIGGAGMMTLAMMTRATLGHSGHALVASRATQFAYVCVVVALVARIAMAFMPDFTESFLCVAAAGWIFAFVSFLAGYGPMLARRSGPPRG
jgi:uncharacterized protein involved in response to NO